MNNVHIIISSLRSTLVFYRPIKIVTLWVINDPHRYLQESQEREKENDKLQKQVTSLNDQLNVLQTELSSLSLEREELNERLSNSTPTQVCVLK